MGYFTRAVVVLIAALSLFPVVRWALGPGNLELFNPDRTGNVAEWASKPLRYLDTEGCATCHKERLGTLQSAAHQSLNCESCHGPATEHVSSGASLAVEEPSELCARCHARLLSRPASQPQVDVEKHAGPLVCTVCHNPHSPSLAGPPNVPHSLVGRSEWCTVCHGPTGVKPFPADHAVRTSETCLACHKSKGSALPGPTPATPPGETTQPTGPPNVPHSLEGRSECTVCHGPAGFKPFPADHAGRTSETCLACHKSQDSALPGPTPTTPPGETTQPTGPPNVPHSLEGRSECTVCHGPTGFKPFPADHAGRTSTICLACHRQQ